MNYLLDKHCILWSISCPEKLSSTVIKILEDSKNRIIVSSLSLWEIALKVRIRKLELSGFYREFLKTLISQRSPLTSFQNPIGLGSLIIFSH